MRLRDMSTGRTGGVVPACRAAGGGFSLAELVLVVSIISILAAMVIPRFANSLALQRADAAARRIAADLALAQRQARVASASRKVTFKTVDSSYKLSDMQDPDHPADEYRVFLSGDPYGATISAVNLGGDNLNEIVFDGYGLPDTGGTIVVAVGGYQKTVTVDPDTGEASVQ